MSYATIELPKVLISARLLIKVRLKKQFLVVMLKKRSSRRYTSSVANDIIIAGTRHANSGSNSYDKQKKPVMKMI